MALKGWMGPGMGDGERQSEATRRKPGRFGVAATAVALVLLAGCDTISDAANGTGQAVQGAGDWVSGLFTGDDQPKAEVPPAPADQPKLGNDERPKLPSATERQQLADSLVADNANAQYTEAEQKRMGDTTRPLASENSEPAPAPAPAPQPAPAASPAPAPAAAANPAPAAPVKKLASASDMPAPSQTEAPPPPPPQPMQVASAAPAPAPAPVPRRPATAGGDLVTDTYRERLAEFSAASVAPPSNAYATPSAGAGGGGSGDMSAASSGKVTATHGSGGAHPLSALDPSKAAASFQVAQILFGEGTAALSAGAEEPLRAVVEVYRDSKGAAKIGIVGHSNSRRLDVSTVANRESNRSLAAERASAVARALEKLGIPASKIFAGAAGEGEGDYAEVFVDY